MAIPFLYLLTFYLFSENEDSVERYDQVSEASEHLSKKLSSPETGKILYLKHSFWSQIKRIQMSTEVITLYYTKYFKCLCGIRTSVFKELYVVQMTNEALVIIEVKIYSYIFNIFKNGTELTLSVQEAETRK